VVDYFDHKNDLKISRWFRQAWHTLFGDKKEEEKIAAVESAVIENAKPVVAKKSKKHWYNLFSKMDQAIVAADVTASVGIGMKI
jgi:hypothetical protein